MAKQCVSEEMLQPLYARNCVLMVQNQAAAAWLTLFFPFLMGALLAI